MASRDIKDLDKTAAQAFELAIARYNEKFPTGPKPFLTCTHRPDAEQNADFLKGRDEAGHIIDKGKIVTNARAGQSPHNYKPAFAWDIAFTDSRGKIDWSHQNFANFNTCLMEVSTVMRWGYDWNGNGVKDKNDFDAPHWELKDWQARIKKPSL